MTEAHIRSNLIGAAKWFLAGGRIAVDVFDELTRPMDKPQLFFSHNEILALQGFPRRDGSWALESESVVVAPERVKLFMEYTHRYAIIFCAMLDKGFTCGPEDEWQYKGEGLYYFFDKSEQDAFQGEQLPSGDWCNRDSVSRTGAISAKRAKVFAHKTHFASTIMCAMLDKLKEIDELSSLSQDSKTQRGASSLANSAADLSSTADAIKTGAISFAPGSLPVFMPSVAAVPDSFQTLGTYELDLKHAITNSPTYFQSFFNDLRPVTSAGIDDDVMSAHCFDEGLYAALVKEMHRYTVAEVSANQDEIASKNAGLGAMVGSFLGLITGNIFAPFLGHSYGKNMTDRSRRIEEFLPDPNLLFSQDPNSFISWSRGQVSAPRLRRLIFDRHLTAEDQVYFRLVPAIVTGDSVYPVQLFKINSSTYFYRPFAAGIGDADGRKQANYDAIKVQRKYFHIRAEGTTEQSPISLSVHGADIEEYQVKLFRFAGQSLDYYYADFKIQPGSIF
jgi:hypothetical protein